ncbi:MAG: hypothetical protein WDO73_32805 [Ignavibacteriota bacterium]
MRCWGGGSRQVAVGKLGCAYSLRATGVTLTITVMDLGVSAKATWDAMKEQTARSNWLAGDEGGMGSAAFAELIKRSADSSAGKCGFVAVKGANVFQIFVTDHADKEDIAGKKEMLEKLRPVAQKAIGRL